jgi:hypothetical protein
MAKAVVQRAEPDSEVKVPPAVPDGTRYVESLGFIDRLVGTERDRRRAEAKNDPLTMSTEEWAAIEDHHDPVDIPEPVEGGDDTDTWGG